MEVILVLIHPWQGLIKGWINPFLLSLPFIETDHEIFQHSIHIISFKES
jgi:hypothetical protein